MIRTITLEEAEPVFRMRMGLVYGPGITSPGDFYDTLCKEISQRWETQSREDYVSSAQEAIGKGVPSDDLKALLRSNLSLRHPVPFAKRLAALKWSAALSLALDDAFEIELSAACERKPSGYTVTQVAVLPTVLPAKTIPVFKLLSQSSPSDYVVSEASYSARRAKWRFAIEDFADLVKNKPVICLGLTGCHRFITDVFSQFIAERKTCVSQLLLIDSEFSPHVKASIGEIMEGQSQVFFISASVADLLRRLKDSEDSGHANLFSTAREVSGWSYLAPFEDIVSVVNADLKSSISSDERARLLDSLFSPSSARWDAYAHSLDFKRQISTRIYDSLSKHVSIDQTLPAYVITGSAASGKTTVAKRVAFDLATKGHLVLWIKRAFYPNVQTLLSNLFKELAEKKLKDRLFIFIDDPLGLGSLTVQEIASRAMSAGVNCTFAIVARTSDWKTKQSHEIIGALEFIEEFRIEDEFTRQELEALPNYLVLLGIYKTKDEAKAEIKRAPSQNASDTLSLLYWLLPQTRKNIQSSIQNEYLRLGEQGSLSKIIIGTYQQTESFLKNAYAMVAAADHYHSPVPIEVLVSAVNVTYSDWIDAVEGNGPAWGILYSEKLRDGTTICYRPRNSVVTQILIEAINGGKLAHSGEVTNLVRLLKACNGTNPIYREFCTNILVPRRKLDKLEYEEGLQLYDAAISSLPFEDRTLKHQKALWIKDKGKNPLLARDVLEEALKSKAYPYTTRAEADEHIHTSLAATILDAYDSDLMSLDEALPQILRNLDRARSEGFFNANAVHVHANLMLRLIDNVEQETGDTYSLINQALVDVDSTLLSLKNPHKVILHGAAKDIELLEDVSGRIYTRLLPLDELSANADDLWERFRRQEGFAVAARKLFYVAKQKDTGTSYNEALSYCLRCIEKIQLEGVSPSSDLCSAAVCIFYAWNVQKYNDSGSRDINWSLLQQLSQTVSTSTKYAGDPFYKFTHALALAQQREWTDAQIIFANIRSSGLPLDTLFERRAILLNTEGIRRKVQGEITEGHDKLYLKVTEDINRDFYLDRYETWPNPGETAHSYISFSYAGPLAVQHIR